MKLFSLLLAVAGTVALLLSTSPGRAQDPESTLNSSGTPPAHRQRAIAGDPDDGYDDPVNYGRALFQAKGCTACHRHQRVNPDSRIGIGPDLSRRPLDPDYLRRWLADPPSIRPGTLMPDLALSEAEIEALIAFINSPEE